MHLSRLASIGYPAAKVQPNRPLLPMLAEVNLVERRSPAPLQDASIGSPILVATSYHASCRTLPGKPRITQGAGLPHSITLRVLSRFPSAMN